MAKKRGATAETRIAQGLHYIDPLSGAVVPPIQPSTTFARERNYELVAPGYSYARDQNPVYETAEQMLVELEEADAALLFSSGMAAAMAVFQALEPGDHVMAPKIMYWGLRGWLLEFCANWGLDLEFYDSTRAGDLQARLRPGKTRILWLETPSNPTWDIADIAQAADAARQAGARLVVDSTVATPVLTRPLTLGADIVMHSATKYLNGHGDVVAGALACREPDELWERIHHVRAHGGAILGSFEAWLLQRGMRTMFLRVQRASESALRIAEHFHGHSKVADVLYPGLPGHPGHAIATRQMQGGYGGMLSLRIRGGRDAALEVAGRCNTFIRATSLGGVESLVEHRFSIEGADSPIPDDLLRLSVGIESAEDLIADLDQALG
jgi:cystathionine gamma-synthase